MSSKKRSRKSSKSRITKLNYEMFEPRKVLAAIFPAYVDGSLTLGNPEAAAPYDLADTFKLETNPNATKTIYLDFDGHFSTNNNWNHNINFPAWNRDGNVNNFGNAELIEIQKQFQNVAEDFAPFDVNVTTKDPGTAALIKSSFADQVYGVRVINTQATGGFGDGIGGVAFLNSFDDNRDNPVFVFNKGVNNGAMTISHEVGHALGLVHDGLGDNEYHPGSGSDETSWGPILGAPFSKNLTQWSNGNYPGSTSTQDDLAVITNFANGINYKSDDVGNTIASATLLETSGDNVFDWGFIERDSDVDFYKFTTSGGLVDLQVKPFGENPNLDVRIKLYDANGSRVLSNNPSTKLDALIKRTIPQGTYYLAIDGVGKRGAYSGYGSLGFYSIEGSIPVQSVGQKIGEVGNIAQLNHEWKTIRLSQYYKNPVVVAGPSTTRGADPVAVRIRNITSNSFQIRINEWDYRDGIHTAERVDYMVIESGTHRLTDGTVLRASKIDSQTNHWNQRTFFGAFDNSAEAPLLFTSVTSTREASAVTTRVDNVTKSGFRLRLQEEQAADQTHRGEEVNWIAIEKGNGQTGSSAFLAGDTGRAVSHVNYTIDFPTSFAQQPSFFAQMQSYFGPDNATLRMRELSSRNATVFVEEERSGDHEIAHTRETIGYFAISQGDIMAQASGVVGSAVVPSSARRTTTTDGDLSPALKQLRQWGETSFELGGHDHHAHDDDDHGCGCNCGACTGTQNDFNRNFNRFRFHTRVNVDVVRRFVRSVHRAFTARLEQNTDSFENHVHDSIDRYFEGAERDFENFRNRLRNHRFNSFFDRNLGLLSKWF